MLTVELMGGLGNQLFQIFTLIAYAKKSNNHYLIEKKSSLPGQYVTRNVYWNNLLEKLGHRLIVDTLQYPLIREKDFHYEELPKISSNDKFKLYGYFQSYKYFQDYKEEILKEMEFDKKREAVLQNTKMDTSNMISLHFRVGDYAKLQNYHPIMSVNYYINSLKYILQKEQELGASAAAQAQAPAQSTILYFCENNDVNYINNTFLTKLQQEFPLLKFIKADGTLEDWEQMILMSTCKHHIIANSSFSWWGAYLSNHTENKIVCYPDKWFGRDAGLKKLDDLFPSQWIKCKTDLGNYLLENVYYINLEDRKDRKELVESELIKLNWKYERFNAIRLKDGRVGCSMSHLKLLEMAKTKNLEYIVIVEDDIQFTKPEQYNYMLSEFNKFMKKYEGEYDVLLLAGNLRPPVAHVSNLIYRISKSWTTTGYIVKRHYYDTLIQNIKEGINLLMKQPAIKGMYEIDSYWQKLQAKDRWYILAPRTVTQRPNFSTIENRYTDYNHLMLDA
jgi:GR25 family glycosyltransferase involved in LPS biosynthesis